METHNNEEQFEQEAQSALDEFFSPIRKQDARSIIDAFKQAYKELHVKLKKAEQERNRWRDRADKWQ